MGFEEKVLGMLDQIMNKQDEHSKILNEHSLKLDKHSQKFETMQTKLDEHGQKFETMQATLDKHSQKFETMQATLDEHSQILRALRTGQEVLGADIEGMKVSNKEQFGSIHNRFEEFTLGFGVIRDEAWKSKTDIQRIKNKVGV